MTRDEIIWAIERDRSNLWAALEGLDEETVTTRPVVGLGYPARPAPMLTDVQEF